VLYLFKLPGSLGGCAEVSLLGRCAGTKAAIAEQLQLGQELKKRIEGREGSGSGDEQVRLSRGGFREGARDMLASPCLRRATHLRARGRVSTGGWALDGWGRSCAQDGASTSASDEEGGGAAAAAAARSQTRLRNAALDILAGTAGWAGATASANPRNHVRPVLAASEAAPCLQP
jgi:hypothetical protein